MRITQRSIATTVLTGLQGNLNRLGETQRQLSSGKQMAKPSDSPTDAVASMQFRGQIAAVKQYARNADDGLGWLGAADNALMGATDQVRRARDLMLQGMSAGSAGSAQSREALAVEVDQIRNALIGVANQKYLDRPVFGGTTAGSVAYNAAGTYVGDTGTVVRTVGDNTKVRVDTAGPAVFGTGPDQLFAVLADVAAHLRGNQGALDADLSRLDAAAARMQAALSDVGGRYNHVDQLRQAADNRAIDLTSQLSDVEDIDLPKTLTDLSLQQTAYEAALAAGARVVQPSLMDFLR